MEGKIRGVVTDFLHINVETAGEWLGLRQCVKFLTKGCSEKGFEGTRTKATLIQYHESSVH